MTTANLQQLIQQDSRATARVLRYLDERGIDHGDQITGAALSAVCGVTSRVWRRWAGGEREMPAGARRLLECVTGISLQWVTLPVEGRVPKALQHADGDEVLVRLSNGTELAARWHQGDTAHSGWYVDDTGEPIVSPSSQVQIVAVLPLK